MEEKYATEEFLARWLAGELSEEELAGFQASDVYKDIAVMDRAAQSLKGPQIDVERALERVTHKIHMPPQKTYKMPLLWLSSVAAAVAILFFGYRYVSGNTTYSTAIGERENILLADGSTVVLNANSSLSYKRFGWENDRTVTLEGEAFFTVTHGSDFKVQTSKGSVSVLGTQFNIRVRKDLKVQCYSGTVLFTPNNSSLAPATLTKGMGIQMQGNSIQPLNPNSNGPDWKDGYSSFSDRPFSEVLEELSIQYPVSFVMDSVQTGRLFSGQFTHNSLQSALKTTMEPMGIHYLISADKRIVTLSE